MAGDVLRPVDDRARTLAKRLLRTASRAALASLEPQTGFPYASLVTVAATLEGKPLLLVSGLSLHTRALAVDSRCSLLLEAAGNGDPLANPRLTIFGRAEFLDRNDEGGRQARQRFLSRHPKAALYADFADFSFARVEPERALLNAGFGRASEMTAGDFLTPLGTSLLTLAAVEADAIGHMNRDHSDGVRLIATVLCGGTDGAWQVTGLDPDGVDMALGDCRLRYHYPEPLVEAGRLRERLTQVVREARAAAALGSVAEKNPG